MNRESLLTTLYPDCQGYLELRALKPGRPMRNEFFSIGDINGIKGFLATHKKNDVFFAVATRDGRAGKKENIVSIPAVWADIDFDKGVTESEANQLIENFPFSPTIIVRSGGGLHLYWKLKEPADKEDIQQVEDILKWISVTLKSDPKSTDASRILRVPNTQNHKYKPPRPVIMSYCNGSTYTLSDFLEHIPIESGPVGKIQRDVHKSDASVDAYAQAALGGELARLSCAGEGTRNATLNECAYSLGTLVGAGAISREHVEGALSGVAASIGLKNHEIKRTIKSGLDSGIQNPREIQLGEQREQGEHREHREQEGAKGSKREQIGSKKGAGGSGFEAQISDGFIGQLREWIKESIGSFTTRDIDQEFNLKTRHEKNIRSRALYKYIKEKLIIKDRAILGKYHILDNTVQFIDMDDECKPSFEMALPLGLNNMVRIPPKSVVVVAGATNSGKTAILLNIAKDNLKSDTPMIYLMSEMGRTEYKTRLERFRDVPSELWKGMRAAERSCGFNSVIWHHNRDGITLVDFLEDIGGEYFKLASGIREIYDALGDGVAVVAIQKKSDMEYGRGGESTAEKSRLYLSVDCLLQCESFVICRMKIVKAKDYPPDNNPNGKEIHFQLRHGAEIVPITGWQWVNERQRLQMIQQYQQRFGTKVHKVPEFFDPECPF